MLPNMLQHDSKRAGWSVPRALGTPGCSRTIAERHALAGARSPSFETGRAAWELGVLAAVYPARKATKVDILDAIATT